jgi:hypothetical protein
MIDSSRYIGLRTAIEVQSMRHLMRPRHSGAHLIREQKEVRPYPAAEARSNSVACRSNSPR